MNGKTTVRENSKGQPYLYDRDGFTHSCEGSEVHPGIFLLWTDCQIDVPANMAYVTWKNSANCPKCAARKAGATP